MKIFKKTNLFLLSIISILSVTLLSCTSSTNSNLTENDSKTLIIGLDDTFVPMGFKNEMGEIVGFDVDLAKKALGNLGYTVKFQPINWDMKETELNNKSIDAIWNGYTKTPAREKKVAFTDSYLNNTQAIVVRADSNINSKNDLSDKIIGTQTASSSLDAIEKDADFLNNIKNSEPILFDTYNEAFLDLDAKRIDAIVVDEILARYYIANKNSSNYKILNDNLGDEEYCVGLRKDDTDLLNALNSEFEKMKSNGEFDQIKSKWFK